MGISLLVADYFIQNSPPLRLSAVAVLEVRCHCIQGLAPPKTIVISWKKYQQARAFSPCIRMIMGSAKPFSRTGTVLKQSEETSDSFTVSEAVPHRSQMHICDYKDVLFIKYESNNSTKDTFLNCVVVFPVKTSES